MAKKRKVKTVSTAASVELGEWKARADLLVEVMNEEDPDRKIDRSALIRKVLRKGLPELEAEYAEALKKKKRRQ